MNYEKLINAADSTLISPRKLERVLVLLKEGPKKQIDVQRELGVPTSAIKYISQELGDIVLKEGDKLSLKDDSLTLVAGIHSHRSATDAEFEKNIELALPELQAIEKSRQRSYRDFDQFRALPESTVEKVRLMFYRGDVEGRKIILVGDNDLASVALGLSRLAKKITVLDLDKNVLNQIKDASMKNSLDVEVINYDVKRELPQELASIYSAAVTDPPYTPQGIKLFASRALKGIGKNSGTIYLNYGYSPRSKERALVVQDGLTKMGLVIEEVRPDFTKYFGAQSIGCSSSLYICRATPMSKPLVRGNFSGDIYTKAGK